MLAAWSEFICGKRKRRDVQVFERNLMSNILSLHADLASGNYKHSQYVAFNISDPKPRRIHKASVRDRVLHHAIYRLMYPFFDRTFIADSFSCRIEKGSHKARKRFQDFSRKASRNYTKTCWVLKCDIRKFFASINHSVLLEILARRIPDLNTLLLLEEIIDSFNGETGVGLPLGNLTSQLFCNVYMNEFDQFVKHNLHVPFYIRYADDFVFLSADKQELNNRLLGIAKFLDQSLNLSLHPDKVYIKTFASGVDFLGWTHFPTHQTIRTVTKRRMYKRIEIHPTSETLQSYLGMLSHGNAYKLQQRVLNYGNTR